MDLNHIIVAGRLGADAELKSTKGGAEFVSLRIANTRTFKDAQGNKQEQTSWVRVVAYGKVGAPIVKFLTKGREIVIEGRLDQRTYDDKDGNKKEIIEVNASRIHLGAQPQGGNGGGSARATSTASNDDFDEAPF